MSEKERVDEQQAEIRFEESNNVIENTPDYPSISVRVVQFPFSQHDDAPNSPSACPGSTRI